MEKKQSINSLNKDALRILEKFAEYQGTHFDSVKCLSEIDFYFRKKSVISFESLDDLIVVGEKIGVDIKVKSCNFQELTSFISPSSPVATYTEEGWIFIHTVFGPFVRYTRLSDSTVVWTLKRRIIRIISSLLDNSDYPRWVLLDKSFAVLNKDYHATNDYISSIFRFIKIEKRDIWAIGIYSAAIGLFSLIIPVTVQSLVNILNFGTVFQPVLVLTFLVLVALGFVGLLNVLQAYVAELIQQRLFLRLAANVVSLLPKTKHSEMKKYYGSEIPNYFLDISIIQKSATILLTSGLGIFLQTIIGLLVLVLYHPIFILFNIIIIGFVVGILFYLIGSVGIDTSIKESKSKHKLASWIQEMNIHTMAIRSSKNSRYAIMRSENLVRDYIFSRQKHFKALMRQMIGFVSLQALGSGLLLGIGGWLVIKGQITLGQLVASELIVAKILDNFSKLTKYLENYYDLCASVDKVNHLLHFEQEAFISRIPEIEKGDPFTIKIENLKVNSSDFFIENFSANKGDIIQIKTSSKLNSAAFLDLLYGLENFDRGKLELGSYNIKDINIAEIRNHIAALRDLDVFSGTISDNMTFGWLDADSREIRKVLEKVGLGKKIDNFPKGLETEILRNGYPFSKEELALFCIARTMLIKPSLILIDDILLYLSRESLIRVLELLKECREFATIVIVSNLTEIQKISNRIYLIDEEKIIEQGKGKNV